MNLKIATAFSILTLSAMAFAQEPASAEAVETVAPAAEETAPAAVRGADAAPVAETAEIAAPAAEAPEAPAATEPASETALEAAAPAEAIETAVPAESSAPAPEAVRGASAETQPVPAKPAPSKVYYETVQTRDDGSAVRTIYVARRATPDTLSSDELMGLHPMKFKIGVSGSIGSYYLSGNEWDDDNYDGLSWRAGVMATIPLNQYTMGVKLGVLFDRSDASNTYTYRDSKDNGVPVSFSFDQMKIDVPVLFTFKSATSRLFFDLGVMAAIPLKDELTVSYTDYDGDKYKATADMIDDDYRKSVDWSMVFGFSIMANEHLSLDLRADLGLSDHYEGYMDFVNLDLSSSSFGIGLTVYPF